MTLLSTDPVVFKCDATTGDILFPLEYAVGLEAIAIGCRVRVNLCAGEWFLDLDAGIPWLPTEDGVITEAQAILGQKFDEVKCRSAFLKELLTCPGVKDVPFLRVSFDNGTRILSVTWIVSSDFGDTPVDTITRKV